MPTTRRRIKRSPTGATEIGPEALVFFKWSHLIPHHQWPWAQGRAPEEVERFFVRHREEIITKYRERYGPNCQFNWSAAWWRDMRAKAR